MRTTYLAFGTLTDSQRSSIILGILSIDPTLRLWSGSATTPADPAPPTLENNQYSYFIPSYSLYIFSFDHPKVVLPFTGNGGCFYIERMNDNLGDLQWFLEKGQGTWQSWMGEEVYWYEEDLADYGMFNRLHKLAPIIRLTGLQVPPNDPIFSQQARCEIALVRLKLCRRLFALHRRRLFSNT